MYDPTLLSGDPTPYLRRGRQIRAETTSRLLRGGTHAIWRSAVDATRGLKKLAAAASAAHTRRRLRRETIRELRGLNDRVLKDIGIPRSQIWAVAESLVIPAIVPEPRPEHRPMATRPSQWQDAQATRVARLPANLNHRSGRIAAGQALAGCG